jgi:glucose-6-phosphate isomerase
MTMANALFSQKLLLEAGGLQQNPQWAGLLEKLPAAVQGVRDAYEGHSLPLLRLPERGDDLDAVAGVVQRLAGYPYLLVLGTGGSSLGGQTLYALADAGFGNRFAGRPKLIFLDNVDPRTFALLAQQIPLDRAGILAISKSGGTAETLMQLLSLQQMGDIKAEQVVVITEPAGGDGAANPLRALAVQHGYQTLEHDPQVGGRFSVLSLVGLLPAMVAGLDARAVRRGANQSLQQLLDPLAAAESIPSAIGAVASVGALQAGLPMQVVMPYVDALRCLGQWHRQLWAESVGKDGLGSTPIPALGTVDQHSQLQLYLDGPNDKFYTLITAGLVTAGLPPLPNTLAKDLNDPRLAYLQGHQMGELLVAMQEATVSTLLAKQRPLRRLDLVGAVDEEAVGALLMHFMLETMLAADLLGVNAFDQPAVESGKVLARQNLAAMVVNPTEKAA